jgi:hypothetical protein
LTVSAGTPDAKAHAYSTEISGYTVDEANGTHTAYYVCTHNAEHKDYGDPEEHSYTLEDGTKCVCGAEKPAATGLKGDVNLDGQITLSDAVLAAEYYMDWEANPITDPVILYNADFNSDGTISLTDAVQIAEYYMDN